MKRICVLLALFLTLSMLAGCNTQSVDSTGTTGVTETVGSDPADTQDKENTPATEEQTILGPLNTPEEFEALIASKFGYYRALGCTFEKPEDIPAFYFFDVGVSNQSDAIYEFTYGEECFFLENIADLFTGILTKLPVADINKDLSVLGITVADIKIPDRWKYFDETDAYYVVISDASGVTDWSVTKVEKGEDETVAVYWETNADWESTVQQAIPGQTNFGKVYMVMTMQMQPDGTYRILSNLPQK